MSRPDHQAPGAGQPVAHRPLALPHRPLAWRAAARRVRPLDLRPERPPLAGYRSGVLASSQAFAHPPQAPPEPELSSDRQSPYPRLSDVPPGDSLRRSMGTETRNAPTVGLPAVYKRLT